ncbi:MAG: tetratricopeptide repeat protein [Prolixibacteraceae bacterium]|nr:tetratricopeptide repeat protein [Prolixibacteraceae bacterium]
MKLGISKVLYSVIILVLYLVSGILLIVKNLFWQEVPDTGMTIFGVVVIGYGLFRGYRAYKLYQTSKENEDEVE